MQQGGVSPVLPPAMIGGKFGTMTRRKEDSISMLDKLSLSLKTSTFRKCLTLRDIGCGIGAKEWDQISWGVIRVVHFWDDRSRNWDVCA